MLQDGIVTGWNGVPLKQLTSNHIESLIVTFHLTQMHLGLLDIVGLGLTHAKPSFSDNPKSSRPETTSNFLYIPEFLGYLTPASHLVTD